MCEGSDRAADLTNRNSQLGIFQTSFVSTYLRIPKCPRQSERRWLSMNSVRSSDLRRVFEFVCTPFQYFHQAIDPSQQQLARLFQQKRICGVDDIARCQSIMNITSGIANVFRQV